MTSEAVDFEGSDMSCEGRRIRIVIDRPGAETDSRRVIVIASGFGRQIHHSCFLAASLRENGFTVYRYDPLDHVGLSDGTIGDYTMSTGERSLDAVCRQAAAAEGVATVGIIATSLSARVALRHAARSSLPAFVITALGVFDVNYTLLRVFGIDLLTTPLEQVPFRLQFEGHEVHSRPFVPDLHAGDWLTTAGTARDVSAARCPLTFLVARDDDWVSADDFVEFIERVMRRQDRVYRVGSIGHEVNRNPVVAAKLINTIVALAIAADQPGDVEDIPVREVEFQELIRKRVIERRYMQNELKAMERSDEVRSIHHHLSV